jgi:hypothetical protein
MNQDFFDRQLAILDLYQENLNEFVVGRLLGSRVKLVNQIAVVQDMNGIPNVPQVYHHQFRIILYFPLPA